MLRRPRSTTAAAAQEPRRQPVDPDHIRAHIRQHHRAERPRTNPRHLHDGETTQRTRHPTSPKACQSNRRQTTAPNHSTKPQRQRHSATAPQPPSRRPSIGMPRIRLRRSAGMPWEARKRFGASIFEEFRPSLQRDLDVLLHVGVHPMGRADDGQGRQLAAHVAGDADGRDALVAFVAAGEVLLLALRLDLRAQRGGVGDAAGGHVLELHGVDEGVAFGLAHLAQQRLAHRGHVQREGGAGLHT